LRSFKERKLNERRNDDILERLDKWQYWEINEKKRFVMAFKWRHGIETTLQKSIGRGHEKKSRSVSSKRKKLINNIFLFFSFVFQKIDGSILIKKSFFNEIEVFKSMKNILIPSPAKNMLKKFASFAHTMNIYII
jgi:hypothetical protein